MSDFEAPPLELEDLATEVGDFICYWGFKKIHGRLWTHIFLSSHPLDAGELMKRLSVSKALISLSLNDLLKFNVITEAGKSSRSTQTYVANPDVLDVILNVLRRRERKMLSKAETGHKMLCSLKPEAIKRAGLDSERIQAMGTMIDQAQNALLSILDLATVDLKPWTDLVNQNKATGNKRSL